MGVHTLDRREAGPRRGDIDPRIEARRQLVREERWHRIRQWLLALVVVATVAAAAFCVTRSPLLDVDAVAVRSGSGAALRTPDDAIIDASGIRHGQRLVDLDPGAAAARVEALPWIAGAQVERTWRAGDVVITVTERSPIAAVDTGDGWVLVDRQRRVLERVPAQPAELETLEGVGVAEEGATLAPDAQAALDVAAALTPGLRSRVAAVRGGDPNALELALRPAGVVHLGRAEQLAEKVRSLQTVFGQVDLKCLVAVDIRVPDSPVLTRDRSCA